MCIVAWCLFYVFDFIAIGLAVTCIPVFGTGVG